MNERPVLLACRLPNCRQKTLAATTTGGHIFEVRCRSNAFYYQDCCKRWRWRLGLESRMLEQKKQLAMKYSELLKLGRLDAGLPIDN